MERASTDVQQMEVVHEIRHEKPTVDGGPVAWWGVLGAWLMFFITWGPAGSFGVFEVYYKSRMLSSYSESTIAWIGSVSSLLLVCSGAFVGPLFDRGYFKSLICIGTVLVVIGMMMLSLSSKYYQIFLSQALCLGIGSGLICIPTISQISISFTAKRPIAVGITTTGVSFGGIVFPILFNALEPKVGFGWTIRVFGFLQLALALAALGLLLQMPKRSTKPRKLFEWRAFTEIPYTTFCVGCFCQYLSYWIPVFYIATYGRSVLGLSDAMSSYLISILHGSSAVGRILPNLLMPKFGAMPVVFTSTLACAVLIFAWISIRQSAGFIVFCVLFGICSGTFVAANPVATLHPKITPSLTIAGERLGMNWLISGLGTLIGAPIAGTLARPQSGDFLHAQIFTGCIMVAAALFMSIPLFVTLKHDRKERKKVSNGVLETSNRN